MIKGNIARARGDLDEAIGCFEKGLAVAPQPYFRIRSMLGEAHLEAGKLDRVVATLEQASSRYDEVRAQVPIRSAKAHYSLGRAY